MFIITEKHNDAVTCICKALDYMENGYPRDIHRNTAYVAETVNVYENVTVPVEVKERQYCYTPEKGFYVNPDYQEYTEGLEARVQELEAIVSSIAAGAQA
jgi:hypothetical protein